MASEGIKAFDQTNPEHKEMVDGVMAHVVTETELPASHANGLDYYTEKAFLSDDGFLSDCGCSGDDGSNGLTEMQKYYVELKALNDIWEQKIKHAKAKGEDMDGNNIQSVSDADDTPSDDILYKHMSVYDNHPPMGCQNDNAFSNASGKRKNRMKFGDLLRAISPANFVKRLKAARLRRHNASKNK